MQTKIKDKVLKWAERLERTIVHLRTSLLVFFKHLEAAVQIIACQNIFLENNCSYSASCAIRLLKV